MRASFHLRSYLRRGALLVCVRLPRSRVFYQILCFLISFTLEVRVHAREAVQLPIAHDVQQEPENCIIESSICAVRTRLGEKYKLVVGETSIVLDQQTTVLRLSATEVSLVAGVIWVQAQGRFIVKTEFGEAQVDKGEFWVRRANEKMFVSATDVSVLLRPRGADEQLIVERGWENWLSRVDKTGRAESGLPTPIEFVPHLERWARLHSGSRKAFEKDVGKFHSYWREASEQAAAIHKALFERKVAALEAEKDREARRRRQVEARNRELNDIFRKRVFEGE